MNDPEESLHTAFDQKEFDQVKLLLNNGADIHTQNSFGKTILHKAITNIIRDPEQPFFHFVKWLVIEKGANVNIKNFLGLSPFHLNVTKSHQFRIAIMKLFIKHGANVNTQDNEGNTPLHYLIDRQTNNEECIQLLIENGAFIDIPNKSGEIVLNEVIHLVRDSKPFVYTLKYGISEKNYRNGFLNNQDFEKLAGNFVWGGGRRKTYFRKKRSKNRHTCINKTRRKRSRKNVTKRARITRRRQRTKKHTTKRSKYHQAKTRWRART